MPTLTRAITHIPIRLDAANVGKLAQLDALAEAYKALCQQYVTAFCTDVEPDKYADAWLDSALSARWQRVVIQHAAGVAQSWRTNRNRAHQAYLDELAAARSTTGCASAHWTKGSPSASPCGWRPTIAAS